jgi:N-methylhydantoinase B
VSVDQVSVSADTGSTPAFFELEIVRGRLQSIVDEAGAVLMRTAFSYVVREAKDFACAITSPEGHTIAQSAQSIPVFLGTMTHTARALLERFPLERWAPGDVIGTNDPWLGTGHLYDLTVMTPVFAEGDIVGFGIAVAHMPDIGGRLSMDTQQIFEEGLRIPPMKLGTLDGLEPMLASILAANVRMPQEVLGDVAAVLNAASVLARDLGNICEEISVARYRAVCSEIESRSEAFMRRAIATVADGEYSASVSAEGVGGNGFTIELKVKVAGDAIEVDFAGSSPQINGGLNSPYAYSRAYVIFALKCLFAPGVSFNEGIIRPITVVAPEASVVNSRFPASGTGRNLVGQFVPTLIFKALDGALPDGTIAGCASPPIVVRVMWKDPTTGAVGVVPVAIYGGMGGRPGKDGPSTLAFPTNTRAVSVEMLEAVCPIMFEEKQFLTDSAGVGRDRGGLGQRVAIRSLSDTVESFVFAQVVGQSPEGVRGGAPSGTASVRVNDTLIEDVSKKLNLVAGDVLRIDSAGGGGFGPPDQRDPRRLADDIENGYVTRSGAEERYASGAPDA